ncbi:MAG: hypothetical protein NVS1B11_23840 [Terriglobales bacterium]
MPFGRRQSDKEQAYANKWTDLADSVFRADNAKHGHVVQFYTNDLFLRECICEFVRSALADNESAIIVASKQHRKGLAKRLQLRGVDVPGALKQGRRESQLRTFGDHRMGPQTAPWTPESVDSVEIQGKSLHNGGFPIIYNVTAYWLGYGAE